MKKWFIWGGWLILTLTMGMAFANKFVGDGDKSDFLIGAATHGHYQIEMACTTCHSEPFGGGEVLQDACTQCHADDLDEAHDSHPKSKFTNPRNADRVKTLDARYCVTCHTEHQLEKTRAMGVTLPDDFCFHCHAELGEERASHKNLPFDSCASAGCHNYHDNRALYEDFLIENAEQPWLKSGAEFMPLEPTAVTALPPHLSADAAADIFAEKRQQHPSVAEEWKHSSHAQAGVDCAACHSNTDAATSWIEKPNHEQCKNCHKAEVQGFLLGKHGMRLGDKVTDDLPPISPAQARLPFTPESAHKEQGCNSCHAAHKFEREFAAIDACLGCHDDEHSRAYRQSPHAAVESNYASSSSVVTCAGCHMPRIETTAQGNTVYTVQHNQNWNLRPNEKMIRSVCMNCHGLEFSIDALADPNLIKNNFNGQPSNAVPSIDWALKRAKADNK